MRKIYWRPNKVSRTELALIAVLAVIGLVAVEVFPVVKQQPFYREKLQAARLARDAFAVIKDERLKRKLTLSEDGDPMQSGLIGDLISPIVTNTGHLPSKQTSVNPNYAALIVHYLKKAGVEPGDVVAVGCSSSFPAINIAVFAALVAVEASPIIITSTSASQWGATHPDFTWLDMERVLNERRVFPYRSVAASRGGIEDRALGLDRAGRQLLDDAIARNNLFMLQPKSYQESVEQRMALYLEHAGDKPIAAYVNTGGGTASVGTKMGKLMFKPGLNRSVPEGAQEFDSVMLRMAEQGIPVVHLSKLVQLAETWGFPVQPTVLPPVGQGKIFTTTQYNTWLAAVVLALLFGALVAFVRLHLGVRLFGVHGRSSSESQPTQMV
jgi:poly-gamma-glutamate system protein